MSSLAKLEDVVKLYGSVQGLGPISLEIADKPTGLLGPNGSGKTTLVRLLLGDLRPTSGRVEVLGQDVAEHAREIQKRIGYAPEGEAVFPGLTGVEAVAYAGRLIGMRKPDAIERAHQVIDFVDLGDARYRLVEKYSTGMRQRLKLAQALVHDPELLILDEPTEGVDPQVRGEILDLIRDLVRTHGIHLLLSTHLLPDVEKLADHVIVLQEGTVVASGTIQDLKRAPKSSHVVRVNGPVEQLMDHLRSKGIGFESMEPSLRVDLEDPRQVLDEVKAAGLVVRHLSPTELSLEEAFQEAIGGGRGG